jgi:hypothetical protein
MSRPYHRGTLTGFVPETVCIFDDTVFFIEITSLILVVQREMRDELLAKKRAFFRWKMDKHYHVAIYSSSS